MSTGKGFDKDNDGASSSLSFPVPRDLSGKKLGDYQVERLLGQGGMGEVYLARQISLDRPVALKVLRPEWTSNRSYMARFEAEALAAAKLNHPNIVTIYAIGAVDDVRFIAMEYVQGTNLREYLAKKGVPELSLALAIMRQAGLAVGAAGEAGLTHRDIKPENLLLTRKGQIKVADFGLAQLPEGDRLHLTAPGTTLGTPMYMSPEQVQGQTVDHRSDLYSLGITFYHMLTGSPPFRAETAVALALKHVRDKPVSLAERRPDLPPGISALVMKLMEKLPDNRYRSAGEMLRDLAKIKESLQAANLSMTSGGGSSAEASVVELDEPTWKPSLKSMFLVGVPMLLIGGVLGFFGRSEDLLSPTSATGGALPITWTIDWKVIPRKPTAEAQYRHAQFRSTPLDREAAWLAVPGRFPKDSDRALATYIQLARMYLRRGDAERLEALSLTISETEKGREAAREKWLNLAKVAHAASAAVKGDFKEVSAGYGNIRNFALMDPAVAELSMEIAAMGFVSSDGSVGPMARFRNQLLGPLQLMPALLEIAPAAPGGG